MRLSCSRCMGAVDIEPTVAEDIARVEGYLQALRELEQWGDAAVRSKGELLRDWHQLQVRNLPLQRLEGG